MKRFEMHKSCIGISAQEWPHQRLDSCPPGAECASFQISCGAVYGHGSNQCYAVHLLIQLGLACQLIDAAVAQHGVAAGKADARGDKLLVCPHESDVCGD